MQIYASTTIPQGLVAFIAIVIIFTTRTEVNCKTEKNLESQSLEKTWTSIHTITRDIACDVAREIACVICRFSVALGDGSLLDEKNERNAKAKAKTSQRGFPGVQGWHRQGTKLTFLARSRLAPKFSKVVAKANKLGAIKKKG